MATPQTVLIIGFDPDKLDFNAPNTPNGATREGVKAGLAGLKDAFEAKGDRLDYCLFDPRGPVEAPIAAQLAKGPYDCVVIGAGIRLPPNGLLVFERVINAVHRHAPGAAIAFNTRPQDTVEAAERWRREG